MSYQRKNRFAKREYLDEENVIQDMTDEENEITDGSTLSNIRNNIPSFSSITLKKVLIVIVIILSLYLLYNIIKSLFGTQGLSEIMNNGDMFTSDFLTPIDINTQDMPVMPLV